MSTNTKPAYPMYYLGRPRDMYEDRFPQQLRDVTR
jgi:hypothetical protein